MTKKLAFSLDSTQKPIKITKNVTKNRRKKFPKKALLSEATTDQSVKARSIVIFNNKEVNSATNKPLEVGPLRRPNSQQETFASDEQSEAANGSGVHSAMNARFAYLASSLAFFLSSFLLLASAFLFLLACCSAWIFSILCLSFLSFQMASIKTLLFLNWLPLEPR